MRTQARYLDIPVPDVRSGSVLVRVESQSLMSYLKPYVEGKFTAYRAPENFVPGGNAIGRVEVVGEDVWHLKKGQRVVTSSHLLASENVQELEQILIGVTSPGGIGDALQQSWKDGTLAEYVLLPADAVTPIEGLDDYSLPLMLMFNNLEIVGNFMHAQNADLPLLALIRSGQLNMNPINQRCSRHLTFNKLWNALATLGSLELVAATSTPNDFLDSATKSAACRSL